MSETGLQSLRRKRRRIHANLTQLEPLVADYHAKLAAVEAAILALDPQLWLPPRRYKPNPVFARQELPRLTMAILREAKGPVAVREIARLALAAKGVRHPEPSIMKKTRVRLQQYLGKLDRRGVTRKVGSGNGTRRVLACIRN
jgi:hypothetical protein